MEIISKFIFVSYKIPPDFILYLFLFNTISIGLVPHFMALTAIISLVYYFNYMVLLAFQLLYLRGIPRNWIYFLFICFPLLRHPLKTIFFDH